MACTEYEREMIPRAFEWVEASGGTNPVPFDTNSIYGWTVVWYLIISFNIRDKWNALFGTSRPSETKL
ncbi:hypothetical protein BJX96DRAFT_147375 [Aspergillus floccosus]